MISLYMYVVYMYSIYFANIYMFIHLYIDILIFYFMYKYI